MQTFLSDILHVISQALLAPDIILLIALIAYAIFSIGSIIVEFFTERRHYKVVMPQFLAALTSASETLIPSVVEESGLLKRQKEALMTVYEYRHLPGDALVALVRRLMTQEEAHYERITARNAMAAKVAPMLGLVGTLIPLGPGIQALGQANTELLSSSLLVAFDTTVAGLVVAAVCLVIGKIRSMWYDNYLSALDSSMATMVQKIEDSRQPSAADEGAREMPEPYGAGVGTGVFNGLRSASDLGVGYGSQANLTGQVPFGTAAMAASVDSVPMASVVTEEEACMGSGMPLRPDYDHFIAADMGAPRTYQPMDLDDDDTLPVD